MELVKRIQNKGSLVYSNIPKKNIVVVRKIESLRHSIYSYYLTIKDRKKENGTYIIKKLSLGYRNLTWNRFAGSKSYFCYADAGICYSLTKKDKNIFKLNNKVVAIKLLKILLQNSPEYLYVLVNRKNGNETYFVSNSWYNSDHHKNSLLILK